MKQITCPSIFWYRPPYTHNNNKIILYGCKDGILPNIEFIDPVHHADTLTVKMQKKIPYET